MVAMSRALMMDPSVLLLDEPSAGLSPVRQDETFISVAADQPRGRLDHDRRAERPPRLQICDRGYVLDQGKRRVHGHRPRPDERPQGDRAVPRHPRHDERGHDVDADGGRLTRRIMLRPGTRAPRIALAGAVAAGVLGLSACRHPRRLDALPEGVTVGIQQNRDDYGPRRLEIKVANDGDDAIRVTRATVTSSVFATAASTERAIRDPERSDPRSAGGARRDRVRPGNSRGHTRADRVRDVRRTGRRSHGDAGRPIRCDRCACTPRTASRRRRSRSSTSSRRTRCAWWMSLAFRRAQLDVAISPRGASGAAGSVTLDSIGRTILIRPPAADSWPVGAAYSASDGASVVTLDIVPNNCNAAHRRRRQAGHLLPLRGENATPAARAPSTSA